MAPAPLRDALPLAAGELERQRLLQLTSAAYRFEHDTLRAYVYATIPPARRQQFHQHALATLAATATASPLTLLHHAQQAQDRDAIGRYGLQAGHDALRAFAFASADAQFTLALAHLPADASRARYDALCGRIRARDARGDRPGQDADTALLLTVAAELADVIAVATAHYLRADLLWKIGDQAGAQAGAAQAQAAAERAGLATIAADSMTLLARIARNRGDFAQAANSLREAQQLYQANGNRFGVAGTLDKLANLLHEQGEYQTAADRHTEAAAIFRALGHARQAIRASSGLAKARRAQGDYAAARQLHAANVKASDELGDRESVWVEQVILGNLAYELGDYAAALGWYKAGLAICRQLQDPFAAALVGYNLGEAYREQADYRQARSQYETALAICDARAFRRGAGNIHHSLGLLALATGDVAAAAASLATARAIWEELGQGLKLIETTVAQALVALQQEEVAAASSLIRMALAGLDAQQRSTVRWRWSHYVAYRVDSTAGRTADGLAHLRQAAQALTDVAAGIPAAERSQFLTQVPINRQIQAAVAAHSTQIDVSLPRQEVPLGRKLQPADFMTVRWTVASPLDDAVSGKGARRRQQIARLLAEAAAQGAAPTDADLARALNVATRTIARDIAQMLAAGAAVPTRRRAAGRG